jgi:dihydroflavonol-4-reductase
MTFDPAGALEPDPTAWPVLVTGAGGFVGGHIARHLAMVGHQVRGLTRVLPVEFPGDPPIGWMIGDVRNPAALRAAVAGMRGVIHTAAWVSLGRDRHGLSRTINVDATRGLLNEARRAGVERFVHTSTIHTLAAGTRQAPADEETPWNLHAVDSPYCRTKREAEMIVRQAGDASFQTIVLCPGMVLGPRDPKPTSTRLLQTLASTPIAVVPNGGIPIVDTNIISLVHRRALVAGRPGERYAVVGTYLSYIELAKMVAEVAGRPWRVLIMPDFLEAPFKCVASLIERSRLAQEISATTVAGGYLRLYVSGLKADECFGLVHPPPIESIRAAL